MRHDHDIQNWPAQEPSMDFADRAVTAMLTDDEASCAKPTRSNRALGKVVRWPGLFVLAAALVAATAWGRVLIASPPPAAEAVEEKAEPVAPQTKTGAKDVFARSFDPPQRFAEPAPTIAPRVWPPPEPVAKAEVEGELPRFVPVPRCQCQADGLICSCYDD